MTWPWGWKRRAIAAETACTRWVNRTQELAVELRTCREERMADNPVASLYVATRKSHDGRWWWKIVNSDHMTVASCSPRLAMPTADEAILAARTAFGNELRIYGE